MKHFTTRKAKNFHLVTPLSSSRPNIPPVFVDPFGNALSKPNHIFGGQKSLNHPPGDSTILNTPKKSTGKLFIVITHINSVKKTLRIKFSLLKIS